MLRQASAIPKFGMLPRIERSIPYLIEESGFQRFGEIVGAIPKTSGSGGTGPPTPPGPVVSQGYSVLTTAGTTLAVLFLAVGFLVFDALAFCTFGFGWSQDGR